MVLAIATTIEENKNGLFCTLGRIELVEVGAADRRLCILDGVPIRNAFETFHAFVNATDMGKPLYGKHGAGVSSMGKPLHQWGSIATLA